MHGRLQGHLQGTATLLLASVDRMIGKLRWEHAQDCQTGVPAECVSSTVARPAFEDCLLSDVYTHEMARLHCNSWWVLQACAFHCGPCQRPVEKRTKTDDPTSECHERCCSCRQHAHWGELSTIKESRGKAQRLVRLARGPRYGLPCKLGLEIVTPRFILQSVSVATNPSYRSYDKIYTLC